MEPRVPNEPAGPSETGSDRMARADLTLGPRVRRLRRFWRTIPGPPRCKMCYSPFGPPGGPVLRLIGKGRWPGNPKYCSGCFKDIYRKREGAEIECSLLFADIRGSTALAESMTPTEFRTLLDRFYKTATAVLIEHDAIVDKFVGDEIIGIFVPALTEGSHAASAVDAALALLRATGHEGIGPWAPIGIGINTGTAYVGAVGTAEHVEFTALGDIVNVTARLSSAAGAGEILVTEATGQAAGLGSADEPDDLERRSLDLRGKSESTDVLVLTLTPAG